MDEHQGSDNNPDLRAATVERGLLFLISALHKHIRRALDRGLKESVDPELTVTHADILLYLHLQPQATVKDVREFVGVTKSTMTVLLRKLESLGYVTRKTDADDRRVIWLRTTAKSEGLLDAAREVGETVSEGLLAPLNEAERGQLIRLLQRVREHVDHQDR